MSDSFWMMVAILGLISLAGITISIRKAREIQKLTAAKPPSLFLRRMPRELPADLTSVPIGELSLGINQLSGFVRGVNPDWIIGVHPGGRLLSVYIANRLEIPLHRCLFAHTEPERSDEIVIRGANSLEGRVLVVDDIARTGKTLKAVRSHLTVGTQRGLYQIMRQWFAVLLIVKRDKDIVFDPDWHGFTTLNSGIAFPWSILSERVKDEFNKRAKGLSFDQKYIDIHERMAEDTNFTFKMAQQAIECPVAFTDLMSPRKILARRHPEWHAALMQS